MEHRHDVPFAGDRRGGHLVASGQPAPRGRPDYRPALDRDLADLRSELERQSRHVPERLANDINAVLDALERQQGRRGLEAVALLLRRFADQAMSRPPVVLGILALRLESLAHRLEIIAIYRG